MLKGWQEFKMAMNKFEKLKSLIKQLKNLEANYSLNKITPRSYETRRATIDTKINNIIFD